MSTGTTTTPPSKMQRYASIRTEIDEFEATEEEGDNSNGNFTTAAAQQYRRIDDEGNNNNIVTATNGNKDAESNQLQWEDFTQEKENIKKRKASAVSSREKSHQRGDSFVSVDWDSPLEEDWMNASPTNGNNNNSSSQQQHSNNHLHHQYNTPDASSSSSTSLHYDPSQSSPYIFALQSHTHRPHHITKHRVKKFGTRHRNTFIEKKPKVPAVASMSMSSYSNEPIGFAEEKQAYQKSLHDQEQMGIIRQKLQQRMQNIKRGGSISRYWKSNRSGRAERDANDEESGSSTISSSTQQQQPPHHHHPHSMQKMDIFKPREDPLERKDIFSHVGGVHGATTSMLPSSHGSPIGAFVGMRRTKSIPLHAHHRQRRAKHPHHMNRIGGGSSSNHGGTHRTSTMDLFHGHHNSQSSSHSDASQSQSKLFGDNPKVIEGKPKPLPMHTVTYPETNLSDYFKDTHGFVHGELTFPTESIDEYSQVLELPHISPSSQTDERNNTFTFNTTFIDGELRDVNDLSIYDMEKVDEFARQVPYENTRTVHRLGESLCYRWSADVEKVRCIYTWICENIAHVNENYYQEYAPGLLTRSKTKASFDLLHSPHEDGHSTHSNRGILEDRDESSTLHDEDDSNSHLSPPSDGEGLNPIQSEAHRLSSTIALETRHATHEGFSSLFYDLCQVGDIRCDIVHGWVKDLNHKIGAPIFAMRPNHSWNVVEIENRCFLMDSMFGAGMTHKDNFKKQFNPHYFATVPKLFIRDHYPERDEYQMLSPPLSRKYFEEMAHLRPCAFHLGLRPLNDEAKKESLVVQNRVTYAFALDSVQPEVISLHMICKSSSAVSDLSRFTTHILKDDRLYVYCSFPFKGHYELQIFIKQASYMTNFESHVLTYHIKALASLPLDIGYYKYSPTWDEKHKGLFFVVSPSQDELLKHSVVPFKVITTRPVERVVVAVGCLPDGAFTAGKSYTHKRELREHQRCVYMGTLKLNPLVSTYGKEVVKILILPKGEKLPQDEYGWLKYVAVQYSLVDRYSEFEEDLGKNWILKSLEDQREDIIFEHLDVSHLRDDVDQIEKEGALVPAFADKGFKLVIPRKTGIISVRTGEFFLIQLEIPRGYMISCKFSRFNTYSHPCLIYYDEKLNLVTLRGFFIEKGDYFLKLFARKFGENTAPICAKYIIKVSGDRKFEFKYPVWQSLAYEDFMVTSPIQRNSQFKREYFMSMIIQQKLSFKGLQYKSGKDLSQNVMDLNDETRDVKLWSGRISLEPGDFLRSSRFSKPFLILDKRVHGISDMAIPRQDNEEEVLLGDPQAQLNVREWTKQCITVPRGDDTFTMILEVGNPKYKLDAKFVDFTGISYPQGFFQEEHEGGGINGNGSYYKLRCRAKRPTIYRLSISFRITSNKADDTSKGTDNGNSSKVKNGPQYYLFFDF